MGRRITLVFCFFCAFSAESLLADHRFIVRTDGGLETLQSVCSLIGCSVARGLDDSLGQLFLVTTSDLVDPDAFLKTLLAQRGVVDAELDRLAKILQGPSFEIPSALWDVAAVDYYGQSVPRGYVSQIANQILRISEGQSAFDVRGAGIVAVIDTGIDPDHPALKSVLVGGYDFVRDKEGQPSELADLNQSTAALVDQVQTVWVNQSTAALVDQSTAALVDNPQYAAFGHGTMVAGVVHLVAPRAMIMPLKAFRADGAGYLSDILRAIYRSVQSNAKIINMSFSLATFSEALRQAIEYAHRNRVICIASVGNGGNSELVYPAALSPVMGVASTSNDDQRSLFSNYGQGFVWVAAPGEGIVTTYPLGTYAAAWGTSFSAPFVSGAVALLADVQPDIDSSRAAQAVANAQWISVELGNGRLDLYRAIQALRRALGLP